eukprot:121701-Rhodomonas_salina.2
MMHRERCSTARSGPARRLRQRRPVKPLTWLHRTKTKSQRLSLGGGDFWYRDSPLPLLLICRGRCKSLSITLYSWHHVTTVSTINNLKSGLWLRAAFRSRDASRARSRGPPRDAPGAAPRAPQTRTRSR